MAALPFLADEEICTDEIADPVRTRLVAVDDGIRARRQIWRNLERNRNPQAEIAKTSPIGNFESAERDIQIVNERPRRVIGQLG